MFYYIKGTLAYLDPTFAVVDAGGVGYKMTISTTTHDAMPPHLTVNTPPEVKLYTYMAVREDGVELFGFGTHVSCEQRCNGCRCYGSKRQPYGQIH